MQNIIKPFPFLLILGAIVFFIFAAFVAGPIRKPTPYVWANLTGATNATTVSKANIPQKNFVWASMKFGVMAADLARGCRVFLLNDQRQTLDWSDQQKPCNQLTESDFDAVMRGFSKLAERGKEFGEVFGNAVKELLRSIPKLPPVAP